MHVWLIKYKTTDDPDSCTCQISPISIFKKKDVHTFLTKQTTLKRYRANSPHIKIRHLSRGEDDCIITFTSLFIESRYELCSGKSKINRCTCSLLFRRWVCASKIF